MHSVIVLNMDYTFLNKIDAERAVRLIKKGRATVEKLSDIVWHSAKEEVIIPLVLRLTYMVRSVYKRGVQWSKRNVMVRDNFTCVYCSAKKDDIKYNKLREPYKVEVNIDHVHPQSKGGKNTFENTVCSCKVCNERKDDKDLSEVNMYFKNRTFRPYQPTIAEFTQKLNKSLGLNELIKELFS